MFPSKKMAVSDEHLKAPDAPHGVTKTTDSYNDWPNDAGVRTVFIFPLLFLWLLAKLILFLSLRPTVKKPIPSNSKYMEKSQHMPREFCSRYNNVWRPRKTETYLEASSTEPVLVVIKSPPLKTKLLLYPTGLMASPKRTASSSYHHRTEMLLRASGITHATVATNS